MRIEKKKTIQNKEKNQLEENWFKKKRNKTKRSKFL